MINDKVCSVSMLEESILKVKHCRYSWRVSKSDGEDDSICGSKVGMDIRSHMSKFSLDNAEELGNEKDAG